MVYMQQHCVALCSPRKQQLLGSKMADESEEVTARESRIPRLDNSTDKADTKKVGTWIEHLSMVYKPGRCPSQDLLTAINLDLNATSHNPPASLIELKTPAAASQHPDPPCTPAEKKSSTISTTPLSSKTPDSPPTPYPGEWPVSGKGTPEKENVVSVADENNPNTSDMNVPGFEERSYLRKENKSETGAGDINDDVGVGTQFTIEVGVGAEMEKEVRAENAQIVRKSMLQKSPRYPGDWPNSGVVTPENPMKIDTSIHTITITTIQALGSRNNSSPPEMKYMGEHEADLRLESTEEVELNVRRASPTPSNIPPHPGNWPNSGTVTPEKSVNTDVNTITINDIQVTELSESARPASSGGNHTENPQGESSVQLSEELKLNVWVETSISDQSPRRPGAWPNSRSMTPEKPAKAETNMITIITDTDLQVMESTLNIDSRKSQTKNAENSESWLHLEILEKRNLSSPAASPTPSNPPPHPGTWPTNSSTVTLKKPAIGTIPINTSTTSNTTVNPPKQDITCSRECIDAMGLSIHSVNLFLEKAPMSPRHSGELPNKATKKEQQSRPTPSPEEVPGSFPVQASVDAENENLRPVISDHGVVRIPESVLETRGEDAIKEESYPSPTTEVPGSFPRTRPVNCDTRIWSDKVEMKKVLRRLMTESVDDVEDKSISNFSDCSDSKFESQVPYESSSNGAHYPGGWPKPNDHCAANLNTQRVESPRCLASNRQHNISSTSSDKWRWQAAEGESSNLAARASDKQVLQSTRTINVGVQAMEDGGGGVILISTPKPSQLSDRYPAEVQTKKNLSVLRVPRVVAQSTRQNSVTVEPVKNNTAALTALPQNPQPLPPVPQEPGTPPLTLFNLLPAKPSTRPPLTHMHHFSPNPHSTISDPPGAAFLTALPPLKNGIPDLFAADFNPAVNANTGWRARLRKVWARTVKPWRRDGASHKRRIGGAGGRDRRDGDVGAGVKKNSVKRAVRKAGSRPADGMKKGNHDTENGWIGGGKNLARTPEAGYVSASSGARVCLLTFLVMFLLSSLASTPSIKTHYFAIRSTLPRYPVSGPLWGNHQPVHSSEFPKVDTRAILMSLEILLLISVAIIILHHIRLRIIQWRGSLLGWYHECWVSFPRWYISQAQNLRTIIPIIVLTASILLTKIHVWSKTGFQLPGRDLSDTFAAVTLETYTSLATPTKTQTVIKTGISVETVLVTTPSPPVAIVESADLVWDDADIMWDPEPVEDPDISAQPSKKGGVEERKSVVSRNRYRPKATGHWPMRRKARRHGYGGKTERRRGKRTEQQHQKDAAPDFGQSLEASGIGGESDNRGGFNSRPLPHTDRHRRGSFRWRRKVRSSMSTSPSPSPTLAPSTSSSSPPSTPSSPQHQPPLQHPHRNNNRKPSLQQKQPNERGIATRNRDDGVLEGGGGVGGTVALVVVAGAVLSAVVAVLAMLGAM